MNLSRHHRPAPGFSLIELLITLALMVILTSMMFGFASQHHQKGQKELCAENLAKIYLAFQIYANDYKGSLPVNTNAQTSELALEPLVPKYSADTTIFICPGGRDSQIPSGAPLSKNKISYAYFMGRRLDSAQNVLMSDREVNTLPKKQGEQVFSLNGRPPGNNHHKYGGNFLMGDGSVQDSGPQLAFPLAVPPGVVLLNPKP